MNIALNINENNRSNFLVNGTPKLQGNVQQRVREIQHNIQMRKTESLKEMERRQFVETSLEKGRRSTISTYKVKPVTSSIKMQVALYEKLSSASSSPVQRHKAMEIEKKQLKDSLDDLYNNIKQVKIRPALPSFEEMNPNQKNLIVSSQSEQTESLVEIQLVKQVEDTLDGQSIQEEANITAAVIEKTIVELIEELPESEKKKINFNLPSFEFLKQFQEVTKKAITSTQFYQFLLKADQKNFRHDFLLMGPWISFVKVDLSNSKPILVKQMEENFKNAKSFEEKDMILKFAISLVKRGMISKDAFELFNKENMPKLREQALLNEHSTFEKIAKKFEKSHPSSQKTIIYNVKNPSALSEQFGKIAKGSMGQKEKEQFIKDFAQDLSTLSQNHLKSIRSFELHGKKWDNKDDLTTSPNVREMIAYSNKLSYFVAEQILANFSAKKEEPLRMYKTFVLIAKELIKLHDYHSASAIFTGLNLSPISRLNLDQLLDKEFSNDLKAIETLFNASANYNNLRITLTMYDLIEKESYIANGKSIPQIDHLNTPYVPFIGLWLSDLIFTEDGNPDLLPSGEINFEKAKDQLKMHKKLKSAQKKLKSQSQLNYNVVEEVGKQKKEVKELDTISQSYMPRGQLLVKGFTSIKLKPKPAPKQ